MRVASGAGLDVARVRRRIARSLVGPGFKIVDRINDAAAKLTEGRPAAVAAIFSSVRGEMPSMRAASWVRT